MTPKQTALRRYHRMHVAWARLRGMQHGWGASVAATDHLPAGAINERADDVRAAILDRMEAAETPITGAELHYLDTGRDDYGEPSREEIWQAQKQWSYWFNRLPVDVDRYAEGVATVYRGYQRTEPEPDIFYPTRPHPHPERYGWKPGDKFTIVERVPSAASERVADRIEQAVADRRAVGFDY